MERQALSIEEFCEAHGISRTTYFELRRASRGPDEMKIGRRTLVSVEAAARWRERIEGENRLDRKAAA